MTQPSPNSTPDDRADLVGIEIGGTKIQVVRGNRHGEITSRVRFQVTPSAGAQGIRDELGTILQQIHEQSPVAAVGVGFGGPVDWQTGRICCSHQIDGWSDFNLTAWIGEWTPGPVRVENDANTAALAEAVLGAGQGHQPVFYITLGSGVGGGLVLGHSIYHGAFPGETEVGHLRLDRDGTTVEECCSGWAVDRRIRELARSEPEGPLARLLPDRPGSEARCLTHALEQQDPLANRILHETAANLAFALGHVAHLLHPEIIVVGGGLSLLGEPLRRAVADSLPKNIMAAFHPGPKVTLAALGEDAVPRGALLLARASLPPRSMH